VLSKSLTMSLQIWQPTDTHSAYRAHLLRPCPHRHSGANAAFRHLYPGRCVDAGDGSAESRAQEADSLTLMRALHGVRALLTPWAVHCGLNAIGLVPRAKVGNPEPAESNRTPDLRTGIRS
jgi:hypothetical protein